MKRKDYIQSLLFCFGLACLFNLPGCYEGKTQDKGTDTPRVIDKLFVDHRGFISVEYVAKDGETYTYDFMEPEEFRELFGFEIQSHKSDYQLTLLSQDSMKLQKGDSTIGNLFLTDDSEIGSLIIHGKN